MMHARALALTGVLFGFTSRSPQATRQPSPEGQLAGTWLLELRVTQGYAGDAPMQASGQIVLRCVAMSAPAQSTRPCPEYRVAYDSTLRTMLGPEVYGAAGAATAANGQVRLWFNPRIDHGAFYLRGTVRADSVIGEWKRTNYADDGYAGQFVMARAS